MGRRGLEIFCKKNICVMDLICFFVQKGLKKDGCQRSIHDDAVHFLSKLFTFLVSMSIYSNYSYFLPP